MTRRSRELGTVQSNCPAARVDYRPSEGAWASFREEVLRLAAQSTVRTICELGAGANPMLPIEFPSRHGVEYVLVDISEDELNKAPSCYDKLQADVCANDLNLGRTVDLVISRALMEHLRDPIAFHRNVCGILRPGGRAAHFFSTLYAPPFVLNRILPEWLSDRILQFLQPRRQPEGHCAKFRAHYRWCRGPTRAQVGRFQSVGYEVEHYVGFFGTRGYFESLPPLVAIDDAVTRLMVRYPLSYLTSYAYVVLKRV